MLMGYGYYNLKRADGTAVAPNRREPRIEGGPTTSDDDTKEKVTNTVPHSEVSPGAKRATGLIESFPTWTGSECQSTSKNGSEAKVLKRIDA